MRSTRRGGLGRASCAFTPASAALSEVMLAESRRSEAIFSASPSRMVRGCSANAAAALSRANAGTLDIFTLYATNGSWPTPLLTGRLFALPETPKPPVAGRRHHHPYSL